MQLYSESRRNAMENMDSLSHLSTHLSSDELPSRPAGSLFHCSRIELQSSAFFVALLCLPYNTELQD